MYREKVKTPMDTILTLNSFVFQGDCLRKKMGPKVALRLLSATSVDGTSVQSLSQFMNLNVSESGKQKMQNYPNTRGAQRPRNLMELFQGKLYHHYYTCINIASLSST